MYDCSSVERGDVLSLFCEVGDVVCGHENAHVVAGETADAVPQFPKDLLEDGTGFEPSDLDQPYPPMRPVQPPSDPERIREWGRANGFNVPMRGRIPAEVRQAWGQANEND
ncbi:histone-like nucleoid-structuring protein Lsr2 [Streptomyces sp. NPDC127172]|uniref:Lsr2 family DNA-binding protein n=1 Tax=Streptomyces sp. NPDC127172 TaxID=3345382 RepID=UPI003642FBB2